MMTIRAVTPACNNLLDHSDRGGLPQNPKEKKKDKKFQEILEKALDNSRKV